MNKVNNIIITGSSSGIGRSIAEKWCRLGVSKNKNNVYYGISKWNDFDVTDYYQMQESFLNFNNVFALVNNAGVVELGNILELSYESWVNQLNVNLTGVFNCSKAYINYCIKNKRQGKIINIASTAGLGARPGYSGYAASKAAVINFSLSLSEEMRDYGIKVYCVCPGACDTKMRHHMFPDDDFKNMMKPDHVAKFVCNLITQDDFLDGQILKIINRRKSDDGKYF